MKICVWRTGHEIADTVAEAMLTGLRRTSYCLGNNHTSTILNNDYDIHIGYGILRGMGDVFRECDRQGKPWFNIDKGYWKPGHYDGYYRVSLRGTQQTSGWPDPDWERWEKLGLNVEPWQKRNGYTLVCPPTDYVETFLRPGMDNWLNCNSYIKDGLVRHKGCERLLDSDLAAASRVIIFNSSVGWESLRRGIPVESDPVHSIVGAWQAKHGTDKRKELFATMAGLQLTLDEMRSGKLLPLLQKLLDASSSPQV